MWTCDTCGEPISEVKDGWVEWLTEKGGVRSPEKGLRLVHIKPASPRDSCQYNERLYPGFMLKDLPLSYFLGPDGLMILLSFINEGRMPKEEVLEMTKRLHIPGYESARNYFDAAISQGVFEPNTQEGFYRQSNINAVNKAVEDGKL